MKCKLSHSPPLSTATFKVTYRALMMACRMQITVRIHRMGRGRAIARNQRIALSLTIEVRATCKAIKNTEMTSGGTMLFPWTSTKRMSFSSNLLSRVNGRRTTTRPSSRISNL
ncbi:MAG: hypothetical protein QW828_02725 [Candidatus Bathyarchaeia archaeon]